MVAEKENVSLNHLMVSVLASFRGFDAALHDTRADWIEMFDTEKKCRRGL